MKMMRKAVHMVCNVPVSKSGRDLEELHEMCNGCIRTVHGKVFVFSDLAERLLVSNGFRMVSRV